MRPGRPQCLFAVADNVRQAWLLLRHRKRTARSAACSLVPVRYSSLAFLVKVQQPVFARCLRWHLWMRQPMRKCHSQWYQIAAVDPSRNQSVQQQSESLAVNPLVSIASKNCVSGISHHTLPLFDRSTLRPNNDKLQIHRFDSSLRFAQCSPGSVAYFGVSVKYTIVPMTTAIATTIRNTFESVLDIS